MLLRIAALAARMEAREGAHLAGAAEVVRAAPRSEDTSLGNSATFALLSFAPVLRIGWVAIGKQPTHDVERCQQSAGSISFGGEI